MKVPPRTQQLRILLDEGEPLVLHERRGNDLPVEFLQLRLVVEQFQLARSARHEQEDDALGLDQENAVPEQPWGSHAGPRSGDAKSCPSLNSDASPIEPRPTPQSAKKCRRVMSRTPGLFSFRPGMLIRGIGLIPA